MRYLSVCSGIEAATVAWKPLGWQAVAFSEIEKFPCAVLKHHYPIVPNWGDLTKFREWPDATIDLLVGGTPCQSFSVAGLRKGLADPRGNLALTYLAVLDRYRPRWCCFENVPGLLSADGGRAMGALLGGLGELGYGFAYRVLDAQYFGLAQRRARVFVVGHLGDWRRAAAVLFERESLSGHPAPRREAGERAPEGIAGSLGSRGNRSHTELDGHGAYVPEPIPLQYAEQLGREKRQNGMGLGDPGDPMYTLECRQAHGIAYDPAHSLRADGFDASEDGTGLGTPLVPTIAPCLTRNYAKQPDNSDTSAGPMLVAHAFAENQRAELVTSDTMGALKVGGGKPGQGYPAVAFDARQSDVIQYGDISGPLDTDGHTIGILGGRTNGDATQTGPIEALRALRDQIGEEAFARWNAGILVAFWPEEVLRSALHGCGVRYPSWSRNWMVYCALALAEGRAEGAVQSVREAIGDGCASQGWQPSQQLARELGAYLSELSHAGTSAQGVLSHLWQAGEGSRLLQSALSAVEKLGRSEHRATGAMQVRRLTPVECEFLQGFPRNYTLIPYRGKLAADGPRYKALGNSMAVPVMRWIGERIALVEQILKESAA